MTLEAELRALADAIALPDSDLHKRIESALHAAVKRALEREPSEAMIKIGWEELPSTRQDGSGIAIDVGSCYRAMTQQLLREIEE